MGDRSRAPRLGSAPLAGAVLALLVGFARIACAEPLPDPARFIDELRPEAERAGVSAATVTAAFAGFTLDPAVVARTRAQSEFNQAIGVYVTGAVTDGRVVRGRELARRWSAILDRVERETGVPRGIVLAIWAQESGFGQATGRFSTIRSLATLAAIRFRGDFFRSELLDALRIAEEEGLAPGALTGSWAGAMGQPQFLPSSFRRYARDGDGDGHRDIWGSAPDTLLSIATLLAENGWRRDRPWGVEVRLPPGADLSIHARPFADWVARGLVPTEGGALPRDGEGRLFLPAGIAGPAFLLGENWEAIRAYNTSDSYALAIGLLADRIAGGGPLARAWPRTPVLTGDERREVHRRLAGFGLYDGPADGKFGAKTREAVRRFQLSRGLLPDGYADGTFLAALRSAR
ncbi:MAG: lytic murein transglycosylase [Methylobacteriaceae bacterium]|nr:lytic murein transglycosylase [Methylobacteriaceae bacterium]